MFAELIYYQVLGKPLIMYTGIITLISFLLTASIAVLNKMGVRIIPFKWHPRMAALSIILALIHGLMGILLYF